jgi:hypothetical protein
VRGDEVSEDEVSGDEVSDDEVSDDEVSDDEVSDDEVSEDEVSEDEVSGYEVSGDEVSGKEGAMAEEEPEIFHLYLAPHQMKAPPNLLLLEIGPDQEVSAVPANKNLFITNIIMNLSFYYL